MFIKIYLNLILSKVTNKCYLKIGNPLSNINYINCAIVKKYREGMLKK